VSEAVELIRSSIDERLQVLTAEDLA
jgi:hypothetical protein